MISRKIWPRTLAPAMASVALLAIAPALAQPSSEGAVRPRDATDELAQQFVDPPQSARPRVWWHWLNGNVTKEGIDKDLDWMKAVGIGGLQNFDADLATPVIVDKRLVYMTPEWKDAFRHAAAGAEKRGLELAIAASPGWSETGGPWVAPKDGLKKLVWSETLVRGGKRFAGKLPSPPKATGRFLDLPYEDKMAQMGGAKPTVPPQFYGDIAVLAVPAEAAALPVPVVTDANGKSLDHAALADDSLSTSIDLPRGSAETPSVISLTYADAVTVRSATLLVPGAKVMFAGASLLPELQSSTDGVVWKKIADLAVAEVPTTVSFAAVTARMFRVVLKPAQFSGSNMGNAAPGIIPPAFAMMMANAANAPISIAQFRLSGGALIDRYEAKAGFAIEHDYYALGSPDAASPAPAIGQVIDLTSKMQPDGSLDWTAPKGNWKIVRLGYSLVGTVNHPAPAEATGLEVDKFDGDAVRAYMTHYIGMYRDAAGADLIGQRGVRAILTDSIEVGAANWTPKLIAQFKSLRGYDPTPWLPALTGVIIGSRAQSDRFLYDYRRTLADLMASEHYGTVAAVAHENGLKVYGEALEDHRPSLGDDMAMRRFADVPMAALWTFGREAGPNPSYIADMKGAASVAHVYGQNLVAAESMTSALSYWADSPRTLKRVIDTEFVTGVNRPVIHTSVHSPDDGKEPGLSLMIFGQFFNRHEAWGQMARPWVDYIARNSLMLQQGRNVADIAYFTGEEAPLTALYGDQPVADAPTAYAYDFINAGALTDALSNDGNDIVSLGGARYRAIYLGESSRQMTLPVLRKLAALVEGGATVIGLPPVASPGLTDDAADFAALVAKLWPGGPMAMIGKGRVFASDKVEAVLATMQVAPDFAVSGPSDGARLPFVHRLLADGDSYFIVNQSGAPLNVDARFRVSGKAPQIWHAETGTSEPASFRTDNGATVVPLTLGKDESVHVVFRTPTSAPSLAVSPAKLREAAALDGPWQVAFQPGRGAPASAILSTLAPLEKSADPGIRHFSGIATYTRDFAAPKGWKPGKPLWLDLGEAYEVAEIRVNGQAAGSAWHAPYRVDISRQVRPGRNTLEVRVANLWVNRLIGDAQPDAAKVGWTAMPTYAPDAPLQPSGLIGPVRLLSQAN